MVVHGEWYRTSSSTFLHFGFQHLALNALFLAAITPTIEETFGTVNAICIFLLTGVFGSFGARIFGHEFVPRLEIALLNCLSEFGIGHRRSHLPVDDGSTMSVGASGAAYGFNGALVGSLVRNPHIQGVKAPLFYLAYHFASDVFLAFWGGYHNINHAAHIAGGLSGALLGFVLSPNARRRGPDRWLAMRSMVTFALTVGLHIAAVLKAMRVRVPSSLLNLGFVTSGTWHFGRAPARRRRRQVPSRAAKKRTKKRADTGNGDREMSKMARRIEKLEIELATLRAQSDGGEEDEE